MGKGNGKWGVGDGVCRMGNAVWSTGKKITLMR